MKISNFATDKEAEVNGVWQDLGEGAKVLIARAGNPKYNQYLRDLSKPYRNRLRRRNIPEDIAEKLTIKAMAKHVLLDWEGLQDDDGNDVPYSVDQAELYLRNYPDFREIISEIADDMSIFQIEADEEVEEEIKNT